MASRSLRLLFNGAANCIDCESGWIRDDVNLLFDILEETFDTKARSPEKFTNVSDVEVSDDDSLLSSA